MRKEKPVLSTKRPGKKKPFAYVLHTVAYNEEKQIGTTIQCVVAQTQLPKRWIIVSDGSSDRTDEIVKEYAAKYGWIRLKRLERSKKPPYKVTGASLAYARGMAVALEELAGERFDFIGNLDADITFGPDYFERVLEKSASDAKLGIAGGGAYNVRHDGFLMGGGFVQPDFVGGPLQFFRRECLEDIKGYQPYDFPDVIAVVAARIKGWKVQCFPDIRAYHHGQPGNTFREKIPICFGMGRADRVMGGGLMFELCRSGARCLKPPYFAAGLALLMGFIWSGIRGDRCHLAQDMIRFIRKDQNSKILKYLHLI